MDKSPYLSRVPQLPDSMAAVIGFDSEPAEKLKAAISRRLFAMCLNIREARTTHLLAGGEIVDDRP